MSLAYDTYPAVIRAIDYISQGYTESKACAWSGIRTSQLKSVVTSDKEMMALYEDAIQNGYDAMADALLDPKAGLYGETEPAMAKVMSENIKWYLSRRARKVYGEKIEIKQEVTVAFAITDALESAHRRTLELDIRVPAQIEGATYIDVTPQADQTDEEILAELMR